MDNIASSLDRAKKYEALSIFSNDRLTSLMSGIRLADCMRAEISYLDDELEEQGESLDFPKRKINNYYATFYVTFCKL
jgi:hypothetical protein